MRKLRSQLLAAVAISAGLGAVSAADAAQIVLNNTGGVEVGTDAYVGFSKAAQYWGSVLTNNVTINLDVGYAPLDPGVLGSTLSTQYSTTAANLRFALTSLNPTKSALDNQAIANFAVLDAGGNTDVITSGYDDPATKVGINTATRVYDTDDSANNRGVVFTSANAKALGFTGIPPEDADAEITFSSDFAFDFDPTDGIANNSYDFLGIAIHEIGHALGFISGVDVYDFYGNPNGDGAPFGDNAGLYRIATPLDYFRYSNDPSNVAPGSGAALDWSVGGTPYFSLDRGATVFGLGGRQGFFSTGQFNGDGRQASHWKDNTYAGGALCSNPTKTPIGILDPTAGRCEALGVSGLDLAAMDTIGWNINYDVLSRPFYFASTADIYRGDFDGVPEPGAWALMILGFGAVGATMRRRRPALASNALA